MPLFNDNQEVYLNIACMKLQNDEIFVVERAEQALIDSLGLTPDEVGEVREQMAQELHIHRRRHFIAGLQSLLKSGAEVTIDEIYAKKHDQIKEVTFQEEEDRLRVETRTSIYLLPFPITFKVKSDHLK